MLPLLARIAAHHIERSWRKLDGPCLPRLSFSMLKTHTASAPERNSSHDPEGGRIAMPANACAHSIFRHQRFRQNAWRNTGNRRRPCPQGLQRKRKLRHSRHRRGPRNIRSAIPDYPPFCVDTVHAECPKRQRFDYVEEGGLLLCGHDFGFEQQAIGRIRQKEKILLVPYPSKHLLLDSPALPKDAPGQIVAAMRPAFRALS